MRLLVISESPLELAAGRYHAVDTWIRFAQNLAARETVTLWSPVREAADPRRLPPGSWPVEQGALRIAHQDYYTGFASYWRLWPGRAAAWRREAARLMAGHDAVILRVPSPMLGLAARQAERLGKPLVLMVAGDVETQSDRLLASRGLKRLLYRSVLKGLVAQERRWARRAALVYAYSDELEARHRDAGPRLRRFRTAHLSEADIVAREDTCAGPVIRLLRVSWLLPSKGLEPLLEALALLRREGLPVRLELVGKERAPGYQAKLEALAARLGVAGDVVFSGWIPFDRMREVYLRSDVQVISSLAEGTPRCMAEGLARGLPLVSTPAGGCGDVLTDGKDALLVPAGDAPALAAAVKRVISEPELRRALILNGYETAREATFERMGARFLDEVREAVGA